MLSATSRRILFGYPLILVAVLCATAAEPAARPTAKQIAQWVQQLGDNSFAVREDASKKLWMAGDAAESALEEAAKSEDAEVVRRAHDILDKFKWGIYPDTPANVVALIQAYQSTDVNARAGIVQRLLQSGPHGLQAVLKIAKAETDPNQRKALGQLASSKLPAALPQVLEEGKFERFEALLEMGHDSEVIDHNPYTAYWLLRGKLDPRIAHFRSRLDKHPKDQRSAETLAYLYRARGDLKEAAAAAEKAGNVDLLEGILYEAADWKALAARPDRLPEAVGTVDHTAYRAAYARLAGDRKEFQAACAELQKVAQKEPQSDVWRFAVAKAFLLNDRPADGLALLAKVPERHPILFEILCARLQYREAMALVDQSRPADSKEQKQLEILKARTLYQLGEKDKAQALFTRLAAQIKEGVDLSWVESLLEAEYKVGLKEQAFEHCAKAMSDGLPKEMKVIQAGAYLKPFFPDRAETAEVWWELLRLKHKDETNASILKRLRDLMEGKVAAKEVKACIEEADRALAVPQERKVPRDTARRRQVWAGAVAAVGLDDLAHSLLEKAGTPEALLRLGDLLAGKKQWAKAAERYRQAWDKDRIHDDTVPEGKQLDPLPLFLAGSALVKAGQNTEGKKLIEQAHWVLLGDASGRYAFLQALTKRGHGEAVRRETDLLLRVSEPNSYYWGEAARRLGIAALARKDYRQAAEAFEQSMLRCLNTYTHFVQSGAYAGVPAQVHQLRARALLIAGKFEQAQQQIDLALAASPGNVELPIALVPDLERCGHKKEAAALFDRCFAAYEKVCEDYPRCAWAHNSAAWMAACCRRHLDKALEHARKAVELAPTTAGYLDTLAEVYFQRGEKDKAVALQKRVVELDPKKVYFRKQLRRIESGDPSAERPAEDEE